MSDNPQNSPNKRTQVPQTPCQFEVAGLAKGHKTALEVLRSIMVGSSPRIALVTGPRLAGKTSLLQTLEFDVSLTLSEHRVRYVEIDVLVAGMVSAIRDRRYEDFVSELVALGLLIIDDIHRLARKTETMKSLLSVIEPYDIAGKVVLSCCGHPSKIEGIPERLVDVLLSGLVVDLLPKTQ